MNYYPKISIAILFSLAVTLCSAQEIRKVHVGLVYPVSTNGLDAPKISNDFSLQLIGGVSKAEKGFALSGIGSFTRSNEGLMIAGVSNVVKDSAYGVHVAGLLNISGKNSNAVEVAGLANVTNGNSITQVSGLTSMTKGQVSGVQVSGLLSYASSARTQISGLSSAVSGKVDGVQLSGLVNYSREVNTQIAGLINIAKNVKGVQIAGLINIADSSDYPIGLINLIKNGERNLSVSVDETITTMATFRSGGKVLYGIVGAGYNLKFAEETIYGFEAGFGMNIPVMNRLKITPELVAQNLFQSGESDYFKASSRGLAVFRVARSFEVFGGPTFNYVDYPENETKPFVKDFVWKNTKSNGDFQGMYFGFNAGVRVVL